MSQLPIRVYFTQRNNPTAYAELERVHLLEDRPKLFSSGVDEIESGNERRGTTISCSFGLLSFVFRLPPFLGVNEKITSNVSGKLREGGKEIPRDMDGKRPAGHPSSAC